jgi:hypothetical protein
MLRVAKRRTNLALRLLRGPALVLQLAPTLALAPLGNSSNSPLRVPTLVGDSARSVNLVVVRVHLDSQPVRRARSEEAQALDLGSNHNSPKLVRSASLPQVVSAAQAGLIPLQTLRRSDSQEAKLRAHSALQLGRLVSRNRQALAGSGPPLLARALVLALASGPSDRISNNRNNHNNRVRSDSLKLRQLDLEHLDKAVSYCKMALCIVLDDNF